MKLSIYACMAFGLVLSANVVALIPAQADESVQISGKVEHKHGKHQQREGTYARSCAAHGGGFPFYTDSLGAVTYDTPNSSSSTQVSSTTSTK